MFMLGRQSSKEVLNPGQAGRLTRMLQPWMTWAQHVIRVGTATAGIKLAWLECRVGESAGMVGDRWQSAQYIVSWENPSKLQLKYQGRYPGRGFSEQNQSLWIRVVSVGCIEVLSAGNWIPGGWVKAQSFNTPEHWIINQCSWLKGSINSVSIGGVMQVRFSGNIRMVLCDLDVITWRGRSIFSILVTLCYLNKSCVFYVNSNLYWNYTLRYCGRNFYMLVQKPHLDQDEIKGDGLWLTSLKAYSCFLFFICSGGIYHINLKS